MAINKLKSNPNLLVIGITGSNGKTSVKNILYQLLKTKYQVIRTQGNQNTLKGAINTINNQLTPNTEIFICEIGAKCKGDVNKICTLVNPSKAIITSVSSQHLETFKTERNIYLTKKELPDYVGSNYCTYNLDNTLSCQMYNDKLGQKGGVSAHSELGLYANNLHMINYQSYFDIHFGGNTYPCHTALLGEHNIINILLATDMALHLGIDIFKCINTIVNLAPIPHRLQYISAHIDIIDDSYNCSILSSEMALKVLNQINKIKVVCTPGIIEGGKQQYTLNQQLSEYLNIADIVIIVGKTNRKALLSRLDSFTLLSSPEQYDKQKKCVYIVDTLNNAKILFNKILTKQHILLLLNDLPDEYN